MSRRSIRIPNGALTRGREIARWYIGTIGVWISHDSSGTSLEYNQQANNGKKLQRTFSTRYHWMSLIFSQQSFEVKLDRNPNQ
jgi:hypothetical protein